MPHTLTIPLQLFPLLSLADIANQIFVDAMTDKAGLFL